MEMNKTRVRTVICHDLYMDILLKIQNQDDKVFRMEWNEIESSNAPF